MSLQFYHSSEILTSTLVWGTHICWFSILGEYKASQRVAKTILSISTRRRYKLPIITPIKVIMLDICETKWSRGNGTLKVWSWEKPRWSVGYFMSGVSLCSSPWKVVIVCGTVWFMLDQVENLEGGWIDYFKILCCHHNLLPLHFSTQEPSITINMSYGIEKFYKVYVVGALHLHQFLQPVIILVQLRKKKIFTFEPRQTNIGWIISFLA